jgi:hypothetical protein
MVFRLVGLEDEAGSADETGLAGPRLVWLAAGWILAALL